MKRVSLKRALKFINDSNGTIFSLEFQKRSDPNEFRYIRCRTGVRKYLAESPSKPATDFTANYSICVCDMDIASISDKPYRTIPVEGIRRIKMHGSWYEVIQPKERVALRAILQEKRKQKQ